MAKRQAASGGGGGEKLRNSQTPNKEEHRVARGVNRLYFDAATSEQSRMPKTRWALAVAGLLAGGILFAGTVSARAARAQFTVKSWPKSIELPSTAVIAVTQSRDGYLWLGT